jgi:hypothetical protein
MAIPLYIDVDTGEGRTSLTGPIRQRRKFFVNDSVPLNIAFIQAGALITSALLQAGAATMKVGIRQKPGQGSILAVVTSYSLVAQEAQVVLPMNDSGLVAYMAALPPTQNEAEFMLEVEVATSGPTTRCTYFQSPCLIGREVNV